MFPLQMKEKKEYQVQLGNSASKVLSAAAPSESPEILGSRQNSKTWDASNLE
jgi:hypothetical protein